MKNKLVVITGASAGIGQASAELFAEKGYDLALGARRTKRLDDLKKQIRVKSPKINIFTHALDVCDLESVKAFRNQLIKELGAPDIIVNNAGLAAGADHLSVAKEEDWQVMIDTNITGLLRFTRAFLPLSLIHI